MHVDGVEMNVHKLPLSTAVASDGRDGGRVLRPGPFSNAAFFGACLLAAVLGFAAIKSAGSDYLFFASFSLLQFIALASAWNIVGGYTGYVNFGTAGFFAIGVYGTVFLYKVLGLAALRSLDLGVFVISGPWLPYLIVPSLMMFAGAVAGLAGLATGYLTLRIRGIYFGIATLALTIVVQTVVVNTTYLGGARGVYVIRPKAIALFATYIEFLVAAMLLLTVAAVWVSHLMENSRLGWGLRAIRNDEMAAEMCGVPTLRAKLVATSISGAFMGMVGSLFPWLVTYVDPGGTFNLNITIFSVAMVLIGGIGTWQGPLIGAVLLGICDIYFRTKTIIAPEMSVLIVGLSLIFFVIAAPEGIVGLWNRLREKFK
jgi:branched-chain amino acid transport system permease protein